MSEVGTVCIQHPGIRPPGLTGPSCPPWRSGRTCFLKTCGRTVTPAWGWLSGKTLDRCFGSLNSVESSRVHLRLSPYK